MTKGMIPCCLKDYNALHKHYGIKSFINSGSNKVCVVS